MLVAEVASTGVAWHAVALDDIGEGYPLFGEHMDNVMKVAIRP